MMWMLWCAFKVLSELLGSVLVYEGGRDGTRAIKGPEMIDLLPYREVRRMAENSL